MADEQRDRASSELAGEVAGAADQLERDSAEPPVDELADAPAVVARARLVADVARLLPARWLRGTLGEELADPRRRFLRARGPDPGAFGTRVADGQDPRRRPGLTE